MNQSTSTVASLPERPRAAAGSSQADPANEAVRGALTVAVSSRALFYMREAHEVFRAGGQAAFDEYMLQRVDDPLQPGVAFPLIKKLLAINGLQADGGELVSVLLLSDNAPAAGLRVLKSAIHHGLPLKRAVFTKGGSSLSYAAAFRADLFITADASSARDAIERGIAAVHVADRPHVEGAHASTDHQLRIAFDGDSTIFDASGDHRSRTQGLAAFHQHEQEHKHVPMGDGPLANLFRGICALQKHLPDGQHALRIAFVTARGVAAGERCFSTFRSWGVGVDEIFLCGGAEKGPLLRSFNADMFFDDSLAHVQSACDHGVPAGYVPFGPGSAIGVDVAAGAAASSAPVAPVVGAHHRPSRRP